MNEAWANIEHRHIRIICHHFIVTNIEQYMIFHLRGTSPTIFYSYEFNF